MKYEIFKNIERSSRDEKYSQLLSEYGVATVSEAQNKTGIMREYIHPLQQNVSIAGRAITVECTAADNLMIHAAFELCQKGDILVVSTPEHTVNGYFGELMANSAIQRGIAGLVIDGGVRDIKAIRELGFPVWAKYVNVLGTTKKNPGIINKTMKCGGTYITGGDFIVCDDDGVVVVESQMVEKVIENSQKRVEKEVVTRDRIKSGELSINFYNLRPVLSEIGVEYKDGRVV
ncbi:4-carboxy-4-hydroxy-2-oxoadipate aldolase/oxaloacetate decarboxylase [Ferroplasma acidiphilum]|uniref:4-carboxy-4-hydroxy-2-oxoadipate aldolase/oxaloacetate decarboxylase n=1 Tax=Ferroplasma acidiphilum TaxID=74969 RepID=UPI0028162FCC|nr:4-carboxy-4-hydroxy-2-oxoadipate aldolase/oxaloacetate decarboxylase [Ferroplasma acidiphilum]WMT53522.1 MAG: 4-carboxy-4-hydroxy-2-oxoadipate aldolase/oxaloacetate decarboxylase [Ferroplasma acidiphilum]